MAKKPTLPALRNTARDAIRAMLKMVREAETAARIAEQYEEWVYLAAYAIKLERAAADLDQPLRTSERS